MSRVLITGGAGYVGSHVVRALRDAGRRVVVLDDLSSGHRDAVSGAPLVVGNCGDEDVVARTLREHDVDAVVHMAACCLVGESVEHPAAYYRNNVRHATVLLDACREAGVDRLVFSSSAAVYGEPSVVPIPETHDTRPTNPYGETKLVFERALGWYGRAYGVRSVSLRYFNAAGAHPDGDLHERHDPETHLVPNLLGVARSGDGAATVYGRDYDTRDGTCVRDYVHVCDLADAHVSALDRLEGAGDGDPEATAFNLGNGTGASVLEVIEAVERVTGARVPVAYAPRRPGDPATLVASSERARRELGWIPRTPAIEAIVASAWAAEGGGAGTSDPEG